MSDEKEQQPLCSICYDPIETNQIVYPANCPGHHVFHWNCAESWAQRKGDGTNFTCPLCRQQTRMPNQSPCRQWEWGDYDQIGHETLLEAVNEMEQMSPVSSPSPVAFWNPADSPDWLLALLRTIALIYGWAFSYVGEDFTFWLDEGEPTNDQLMNMMSLIREHVPNGTEFVVINLDEEDNILYVTIQTVDRSNLYRIHFRKRFVI